MFEWSGPLFAIATVATIAVGHHLVRKVNYHFGTWPAFPLIGIGMVVFAVSFVVDSNLFSGLLGIVGLTTVVDGIEVFKQEKRIAKGFAPMNPKRSVERILKN